VSVNREKFAKRLLFLFSDLLILTQPVKKVPPFNFTTLIR
jgi:hypothetical protein